MRAELPDSKEAGQNQARKLSLRTLKTHYRRISHAAPRAIFSQVRLRAEQRDSTQGLRPQRTKIANVASPEKALRMNVTKHGQSLPARNRINHRMDVKLDL
jgi:hypothetical protein